ncbi:hypothetical protein [Natrinema salaciae]|uniref:CARDB protein n=1 Tax=Natrinema salaciae TaxID=1186196 RepID=A0A1H9B3M3_9EURY|nr:hypothetical protein [Natrinema salaciae]SEP83459.1 hypothetical protein SAMN04489841_0621 [Natrinema salaciae]
MDRRKFVVGAGIGLGLAGCLDATTDGASGGNRTDDGEQFADADDPSPNQSTGNATGTDDRPDSERNADTEEREETGDGGDGSERDVTFHSCTRATVTGTFEPDDVAFASTGFYDDGLYGNTMIEDGIVFGEDVDAPFSGTVAFEIGSESAVRDGTDEIVVEIPAYGSDGTVISALTTEQEDYLTAGTTHENPNASACLRNVAPDDGDGGATDGEGDATFEIVRLETNTPIDAGAPLEVSATIENTGGTEGTQDLELIVGHSAERVERRAVTLGAGERTALTTGYETPLVANDQEFPIRLESADDAVEESVLVRGTD